MVLPADCPGSMGVIVGICWTKSQSPHYSPGLRGLGLQMTGALRLLNLSPSTQVFLSSRSMACMAFHKIYITDKSHGEQLSTEFSRPLPKFPGLKVSNASDMAPLTAVSRYHSL